MKKDEAKARVAKLREQINEYRYNYHVLNRSIMSESAADSLKHELSVLETSFPDLITPDSPTQRVAGKPLEKFVAVAHEIPMLSLNDVFDRAEVEAWIERCEKLLSHRIRGFFTEIKKDGMAGTLIYVNGNLIQGLTRGDGSVGEDVTQNFRTIESVPLSLRHDSTVVQDVYRERFEVRGEVLLYKKDFEELNSARALAQKPLFANTRNTAAGTMRQLDPSLVAERRLRFLAYLTPSRIKGISTLEQAQDLTKKLGFSVEPHSKILKNIDEIMEFVSEWSEKRKTLEFGTDGLVITINDLDDFDKLGVVGKAPRGAVAFKFPAEQVTTKLHNIMVSIGRTGAATPFAVLEPVSVAGSTVSLATLHNENEIKRKDIRIGDTVIIQKAGDVIPEVVEALPKLRNGSEKSFSMPDKCPVCHTKLLKTPEEAIWRCPNFYCAAQERGRIIHFASKDAFDVEGLGEKVVDQLLEAKLIEDAADIFALHYQGLIALERFADKSAQNLLNSISARKLIPLDKYIFALGIRHVGAQTATDLARHFGSLEYFRKASEEELLAIEGIGGVVAESIIEWLSEDRNIQLLAKLEKLGVKPQSLTLKIGKLNNLVFVITGVLSMGSREEIEAKISDLGGTFSDSVTKSTTHLVVGEDPGKSKIAKADTFATTKISEDELRKLLS
ncbi:MAG: NAD-dependent DNA ligase LigA [Candidatus Saccharimonadia bacterium]